MFCNVRGTEETDLHKSAEDAIINKREAEKVVRLTAVTFNCCLGSLATVPVHDNGVITGADVVSFACACYTLTGTVCFNCISSPGGYSPNDGDCTEWREGQVYQGCTGSADHHRRTEESHSTVTGTDQFGQERDGACSVTSDDRQCKSRYVCVQSWRKMSVMWLGCLSGYILYVDMGRV